MSAAVETRVGSYNPFQRSDDTKADRAVDEFAQLVDLAGLQEYGGPARRRSLLDLADIGMAFYKPKEIATAPPIIWRADRYILLRARTPLVADGRRVNAIPGRRGTLPDYHGTVVVLHDLLLGTEVVVGNIHTPAHVEHWPGPRRAMYREAITGITADMHLRRPRPAYLVGDFNWDLRSPDAMPRQLLHKRGLVACWSGNPSRVGTHHHRLIDGVFANAYAAEAEVLTTINVGDHLPVVATYRTRNLKENR